MTVRRGVSRPTTARLRWLLAATILGSTLAAATTDSVGAQTADDPNARPATATLAGRVARQHLLSESTTGGPQHGCAAELSDATLIGQTLMPGVEWNSMESLVDDVQSGRIGGWVVMGTPSSSVSAPISALRAAAPIAPLVAVDEEGGRVQRLRDVLGRLPSAREQVAANSPAELQALFAQHARDMRALGFDVDFAPVLDVGEGPGIGDRAFSVEPAVVAEYGAAVSAGLDEGGLLAVVKHFPGHGRASADSHIELPITPSLDELKAVDLEPFRHAFASGAEAVMVGHLDVPGLTDGVPTSLSSDAVQGLLRDELGFTGLVITDSLDMGAITDRWTTPVAVELALVAGNDIALLGNAFEVEAIHTHLAEALADGRLTRTRLVEAAARVLSAKDVFACELPEEAR